MSDIDLGSLKGDALLASLVKQVPKRTAQAALHIGHTKLYEEIGKGNLDAVSGRGNGGSVCW